MSPVLFSMQHKISTLLYCFDTVGRTLLLRRTHAPNAGLWSPCGGKLKTDLGESPYHCALRELREETGMVAEEADLHLTGMVSEAAYENASHWLMFLFEVRKPFTQLPPPHPEGEFHFFAREELEDLPLPETDRRYIWNLFWKYRGGFFASHCQTRPDSELIWHNIETISPQSR